VSAPRTSVTIRAAVAADLNELAALEEECFPDPWARSTLQTALDDEKTLLLVAECGGAVCGYATAWTILDEGELTRMAVTRHARGQGIGAALLQAVWRECWRRGARVVFLEVRAGNEVARRLYERCGFARTGVRRRYYADGEDAVVMKISVSPASL